MYIIQKSKNILIFIVFLLGLANLANAQGKKNEEDDPIKEFLSSGEFGLQRKIVTDGNSLGQKGLTSSVIESKDIKDVLTVDLIDPFQNIVVSGTKTDLNDLDDGIEFDEDDEAMETMHSFTVKIEDYFEKMEKKQDVDVVELLNNLKINRIISSPVKQVVIQGRKYTEGDDIKVRVRRADNDVEFQNMLDSVKVKVENSEEAELIEEMKADALERYNALTLNAETAINIVTVSVQDIVKQEVSFIIDGKTYKLVMKN